MKQARKIKKRTRKGSGKSKGDAGGGNTITKLQENLQKGSREFRKVTGG